MDGDIRIRSIMDDFVNLTDLAPTFLAVAGITPSD